MRSKNGFTFVEILIVVVLLGILAAIAIPHFTNATTEARTSVLTTDLRKIRLQIKMYKLHHENNPPSLLIFEPQMTGTTDITGDTSGTDFGPYMLTIPVEPFTNSNEVTAGGPNGWNYNEVTGEFWAPYDPQL